MLAAFAARLPSDHQVTVNVRELEVDRPSPTTVADGSARAIIIRKAATTETRLIDAGTPWPTLLVSAPGAGLAAAVDELVGTAPAASSRTLPGQRSFASLGHPAVQLGGTRGAEAHIRFAQADVGGPIRAAGIRLVGHHTGVPRDARLVVAVNGGVVRSIPLGGTGRFDFYSDVPRALLLRDNDVTLRVTGRSTRESCGGTRLPFTVEVDGSSSVELRQGQRLPVGFHRFPQVLLPEFDVSVDDASVEGLATAAHVITALQRATHTPLRPRAVAWEAGRGGRRAWLAIARRPESTHGFALPLKPAPFRVLDGDRSELMRFGPDSRFAELVAATVQGRDALVVTHRGWSEGVTALGATLATPRGWFALTGDAWIVPGDGLPFAMQVVGSGLEVVPMVEPAAPWLHRARQAAFGVTSIGLMLFLVLAYPRVVRDGATVDRSKARREPRPGRRPGRSGPGDNQ